MTWGMGRGMGEWGNGEMGRGMGNGGMGKWAGEWGMGEWGNGHTWVETQCDHEGNTTEYRIAVKAMLDKNLSAR